MKRITILFFFLFGISNVLFGVDITEYFDLFENEVQEKLVPELKKEQGYYEQILKKEINQWSDIPTIEIKTILNDFDMIKKNKPNIEYIKSKEKVKHFVMEKTEQRIIFRATFFQNSEKVKKIEVFFNPAIDQIGIYFPEIDENETSLEDSGVNDSLDSNFDLPDYVIKEFEEEIESTEHHILEFNKDEKCIMFQSSFGYRSGWTKTFFYDSGFPKEKQNRLSYAHPIRVTRFYDGKEKGLKDIQELKERRNVDPLFLVKEFFQEENGKKMEDAFQIDEQGNLIMERWSNGYISEKFVYKNRKLENN